MMLIWLALKPYSAEYVAVCSLNSWMMSTERMAAGVPSDVSTLAVPSIMKLFDVGREPMMLMALPTPCRMAALFPGGFDRAGAKKEQLNEVPPVERQLGHLLFADHLAYRSGRRIYDGGLGRDLNGFGEVPSRQLEVDPLDLVDVQLNPRIDSQLESRLLRRDHVFTDGQQRHGVGAQVVCRALSRETGLLIRDGDLDLGHDGAAGVRHRSRDLAGGGLRVERTCRAEHQAQRREE